MVSMVIMCFAQYTSKGLLDPHSFIFMQIENKLLKSIRREEYFSSSEVLQY